MTMASRTTRVEKPPPSATMESVLAPLSRALADSARSKSSSLSFISHQQGGQFSDATPQFDLPGQRRNLPAVLPRGAGCLRGGSPDGKTLLSQGIELRQPVAAGPGDRR